MRMLGALFVIACAAHSCGLPAPALSGVAALDLRAERLLCGTLHGAVGLGLLPPFIAQAAPCYGAATEGPPWSTCAVSPGWEGLPLRPH
jgi:hypothetical protein